METPTLTRPTQLFSEKKGKCEASFRGDSLIEKTELTNGTHFSEVREYVGCSDNGSSNGWRDTILIRFVFTTRVFNEYIKEIFTAVTKDYFPDIVCVNSTFWDITRYGDKVERNGIISFPQFEHNVGMLLELINEKARTAFQQYLSPGMSGKSDR